MGQGEDEGGGGSLQSGDDTDSTVFTPEDVEELVKNLNKDSKARKNAKAGGTSREKYTCKCCGARVDSGVHKCSRCLEAGCEYGKKKCTYY